MSSLYFLTFFLYILLSVCIEQTYVRHYSMHSATISVPRMVRG